MHRFRIWVVLRGEGTDSDDTLLPQDVEAWNLHDALQAAIDRPFPAWFAEDDDVDDGEVVEGDRAQALANSLTPEHVDALSEVLRNWPSMRDFRDD